MNTTPTTYCFLHLWTKPSCYVGAEWPDWYSVVGHHRDSDLLTESNWECWIEFLKELLGDESEIEYEGGFCSNATAKPGWIVVRENHWAVGWVEWIGVHKDVASEILQGIEDKLHDLDGYPVFDEQHWSNKERSEYELCWSHRGAKSDFIADIVKEFELKDTTEDFLIEMDWSWLAELHESLIPSGEYHNDGWPCIDSSVERMTRDDLAKFLRSMKYKKEFLNPHR